MLSLCVINAIVVCKKSININKKAKNKRTFHNYVKHMLNKDLTCKCERTL